MRFEGTLKEFKLRFDLSRIDSAVNGRKSFFMVLWQKKSHTFYSCKKV